MPFALLLLLLAPLACTQVAEAPANAATQDGPDVPETDAPEPGVPELVVDPPPAPSSITVAFWNVENLFDTEDDPAVELDEEFTPDGEKGWDDERYRTKLANLSRVIRDLDEGRGPDVLGLSEVENRGVLEDLVQELADTGRAYEIVHRDSPSFRGIDCALLFDPRAVTLAGQDFLEVDAGATRDILRADLEVSGRPLVVYVNHWPSRGGDEEGVGRREAARTLRLDLDPRLAANPALDVVVTGDLNDSPADPSVLEVLRATREPRGPAELLNTMWALHDDPEAGTHVYRGTWGVLDHLVVSQGLLDDRGLTWREGSTRAMANRYQMYESDSGELFPNRSYGGRYYGGYSDHLPVICRLDVRP